MKNYPKIYIWEGCDNGVARAVEAFCEEWGPYSMNSRRYPLLGLINKEIEPALSVFFESLPDGYRKYMPGAATGMPLAKLIKLMGFDNVVRAQQELLRRFFCFADDESEIDNRFVATMETMIELVWLSACKKAAFSKLPPSDLLVKIDSSINGERVRTYCRLCGNPTEFTSFLEEGVWPEELVDENYKSRLSDKYCSKHRPKRINNSKHGRPDWNAAYRRAVRTAKIYDEELSRLNRQSAKLSFPLAKSGCPDVDSYIQAVIAMRALQPADNAELRDLARKITDCKLTDRKKRILVMSMRGDSQIKIAAMLGISQPAVSKALASIPSAFRLDALR